MPYKNEHSARIKDPKKFKDKPDWSEKGQFRRTKGGNAILPGSGKIDIPDTIGVIWGQLKTQDGDTATVQALRFPKENWTEEKAKAWLKENKIVFILFEPALDDAKSEFTFNYLESIENVEDKNIANVYLYGGVGMEINGEEVAKELRWLKDKILEIDEINLRINSGGGSIFQGLSIIAEMINSDIPINTFNDGVAASMAGVILVVGKQRKCMDYSRMMLHEPSIWGETAQTTKDDKIRKALEAMRTQLMKIISNNTGKSEEELDKIFKDETWYTAEESKKHGYIDEIVSTKREMKNDISTSELINLIAAEWVNEKEEKSETVNVIINDNQEKVDKLEQQNIDLNNEVTQLTTQVEERNTLINKLNNNKNTKKMSNLKIINSHLELNLEADENAALSKIKEIEKVAAQVPELESNLKTANQDIKVKDDEIANLKIEADKAVKAEAGLRKQLLDQVISEANRAGLIDEKENDNYKEKFQNNIEGLRLVISTIKTTPTKMTDFINNKDDNDTVNDAGDRSKWTIRDWEKKDSEGLAKLKNDKPEVYQKLWDKTYKK